MSNFVITKWGFIKMIFFFPAEQLQNCTCTKYIKIYLNMCICVLFRYNISEYNAAFLSADFLT